MRSPRPLVWILLPGDSYVVLFLVLASYCLSLVRDCNAMPKKTT